MEEDFHRKTENETSPTKAAFNSLTIPESVDFREDGITFDVNLPINVHESYALDLMSNFNAHREEILNGDLQKRKDILDEIRKSLLTTKNCQPKLIFTQHYDVISLFEKHMFTLLYSTDEELVILALKILIRLANSFKEFLNAENKETIPKDIANIIDKSEMIQNYTFKLIGNITLQSHQWALQMRAVFPLVFSRAEHVFQLNSGPGRAVDDYVVFALRAYTKMLHNEDELPFEQILIKLFRYGYANPSQNKIETVEYLLLILKDLLKCNFESIAPTLKRCNSFVYSIFKNYIPNIMECHHIQTSRIGLKIIKQAFSNGRQCAQFFCDICDFHAVTGCLLTIHFVDVCVDAAKCIYEIIDSTHDFLIDNFYTFSNPRTGEEINIFNFLWLTTINDETPFNIVLHFTRLMSKMLEFYTLDTLPIDLSIYIPKALEKLDDDNSDLIIWTILALQSLYLRLRIMGSTEKFVESFTSSDGRNYFAEIIFREEDEVITEDVKNYAIVFMNLLKDDGVPCAQLDG
ncbi:hypothetical protein TRFO_10109 [Tritrichomonas foetus]|uniref:Uncharacterized protein n=1 Tax=Tritrichomonas foetus TaxID=1144522 RepID=A0A1J4JAK3_9EUKA|nr:hypothetical protein TRFO_10109 [Tritrichomonas foetus]|eukprot:OHS96184.1 hypothetical protein TRFO_10109 [Tritrichomonas foetus]